MQSSCLTIKLETINVKPKVYQMSLKQTYFYEIQLLLQSIHQKRLLQHIFLLFLTYIVENNEIVIRPMMYLALSYDHRMIDGSEAVRFLVTIKNMIESPERMLLEI